MKILPLPVSLLCILMTINCAEFPTSYEIIEQDRIRLLDFIYEPAEAAPGDTVELTAIFAGKKVTPEMVKWECSRNIVFNEYGTTAALDTVPLDEVQKSHHYSDNTSAIRLTFVIPDSIILTSSYLPDDWSAMLPDADQDALPGDIPLDKEMLHRYFSNDNDISPVSAGEENGSMLSLLPLILQTYSVPMYLYCRIEGMHPIRSSYVVRYNSRFSGIPGVFIPVNNNPVVDSAVLFIVDKSDLALFDPSSTGYQFTSVKLTKDTPMTIAVDNKKSFFIAVHSNRIDSTMSIDAAMGNGTPLNENLFSHWYVEFDKKEKENAGFSDLLTIDEGYFTRNKLISKLYPPQDNTISRATVWVEVNDGFINEFNRPTGSTLEEYSLRFTY